jgi:putative nucleotidyltransferase with HDIG domain
VTHEYAEDCRWQQSEEEIAMTLGAPTTKGTEPAELRWDPESIRPFPAIALKALKLMSGTDTSLLQLCDLIRSDPAFSAAILRIANSPLVAFSKDITNVIQASMLLGFQRMRRVVITVGLKAYLADSFTPAMRLCWRHSVACAIIAERSATWSSLDKEFAYTAGILHDIGRVALASVMSEQYANVIERGAHQPSEVLQSERELCGIDHCQAGRELVAEWDLPEAFLEITGCHHTADARVPGTASLLPPSCALADALGFSVIQWRSPRNYVEILSEFPERVQKRFPSDAKDLAAEIEGEIKVIESA